MKDFVKDGAKNRVGKKWVIREGKNEDAGGILKCRKKNFPNEDLEKQEIKYWQYEFLNNYAGPAHFFVAIDEDEIVGHYAIIPQKFFLNGEERIGSIVVDVMTDPAYRYQGMFTKLAQFSLAFAAEKTKIEFATGYPIRPEVMPGHIRTGWKINFEINTWIMPLSVKNMIKGKNSFIEKIPGFPSLIGLIGTFFFRSFSWLLLRTNKKYHIKRLSRCDNPSFNSFWERFKKFAPKNFMIQERSSEYLSWRYDSNPFRNYIFHTAVNDNNEIIGYVVTRIAVLMGVSAMILVDALFLPGIGKEAIRRLIKDVRESALENNCSMCAMLINQPNPIFPTPWELGFISTPYKFKFITCELGKNTVLNFPGLKWYLMWGDTDDI